ncbi:CoA transferase [Streptomyces sp. Ru71]|uniref:CoA transferase n=1 Tax=Streptomyces sp. Ru71 TaxID=2080746 RepID=UPI000CDD6CF8|nr:CoA transferase [Streptomyces sp. Ru71]POX49308.1 CoA transferase [Streptomyces sp. Ru71]
MTPRLGVGTRPAVSLDVAERLLRHSARALPQGADADPVRLLIGWAGPVARDLPDERAVQAACGLLHVHGRATGGPAPLAVDYASVVAGVLGALGVTAVRVGRARGLDLREVRTSVAQGALLAVGQYLAAATAASPDPELPSSPPPSGAADAEGLATLVTSDGVRAEIETLDPLAWREFWVRLGVPAGLAGRGWLPFQQRFATAVCPLPGALRQAARRCTLAELRAAADDTGVSLLVVRADPAPAACPAPWELTPGPREAHGVPSPRPATADGAVLPLSGLRVVESTRRVQGPLAGHVLRMLGADVVRIEPPGGDPMRWLPPLAGDCSARFLALNAGKPVVEADLTTPQGRDTVRSLAAGADVFLHNWAPGKAARHGLDASDLLSAHPGLVYASASGFGDAFGDRPPVGTDYLAQVHSGLAAAVRPADEPPAPSLLTLTDVLGGLVCAQGALAGLAFRAATRRGARVHSSLLSAGVLVPRPAHRVRRPPLDRPLRTADGHLCLGPDARRHPEAVYRLLDGADPAYPQDAVARFARRTTEEWLARLADAGLTATPVLTDLRDLTRDAAFHAAVAPPDPATGYARPRAPWEFA